jgi:large subunit ribosomal protein L21e
MGSKGLRRKTRKILRKKPRDRGMQPLGKLLHKYNLHDKALIMIDPSIHAGMPHSRYHGKVGVVKGQRGRSYLIELKEGGKIRKLIVRPEHLRPYFDVNGD